VTNLVRCSGPLVHSDCLTAIAGPWWRTRQFFRHTEEVNTPKHVALLRAINVGGHIVKMDRLRSLFEALSFTAVRTFIASGNVLFEASARGTAGLERKIEAHLERSLGFGVATFLRSPDELGSVAEYAAFPPAVVRDAHALWIAFLKVPPDAAARARVAALACETDDFRVQGREIYWLRRATTSEAIVSGAALERAIAGPMTARNVTTVRKLAALAIGAAEA
jgi:uncharacterized protein (DUF1697 family)